MEKLANFAHWVEVVNGKGRAMRSSAWVTSDGCSCIYQYGDRVWEPTQMPEWLSEVTRKVASMCNFPPGVVPNSVNLNRYDGGAQKLGWHSDDEPLFFRDSPHTTIISLSLGASRRFSMRRKASKALLPELTLNSGDILIMSGMVQTYFEHEVPLDTAPEHQGTRYNLTWRFITSHREPCSCASRCESPSCTFSPI